MAPETRGRVALEKRARDLTQAVIAQEMGVSQSQVSDYLRRENRPGPVPRRKGAKSRTIKIPEHWWLTPEEGGPAVPAQTAAPGARAQAERVNRGGRKRGQAVSERVEVAHG